MIRSLRRVGGSAYTGRFRGACSTTSSEESGAGKARNRTSELEESDLTGLPAVLQRSANMLCGLSERTMTQKVLHVGLNSGGVGDKSFCYFLGDSSVFDVSGVGDCTLDVEAVKSSGTYSEVVALPEGVGSSPSSPGAALLPDSFRRNGYQYVVAVSPYVDRPLISPGTALDYTSDGGYVIYGLREALWEASGAMEDIAGLCEDGRAELLSVQVLEGYYLGLVRKT